MGRGRVRAAVLGLALLSAAGVAACGGGGADGPPNTGGGGPSQSDPAGEAVILAAGDIACSGCAQQKTATLLADLSGGGRTAAILPLGDEAYSDGSLSDFEANYAPSWGVPALLALSHPVPGNHEYGETKGEGYFDYFNGAGAATGIAGTRGEGYYSFDVGAWHLVALNSSDGCDAVACGVGSPQHAWLTADLAAHPARCTLAYWHNPRFQGGGETGEEDDIAPLWDALHDAGADVVISAHEHN
jgi:acid phosphatase type 7